MTEEDEAFEDLAKRQGYWGMQGSRKHQILRFTENVESKGTSMTPQQIDALKLALGALEDSPMSRKNKDAIDALRDALADHAMSEVQRLGQEIEQQPKIKTTDPFESSRVADYNRGWNDSLFASGVVKQTEQEPVAWPCHIIEADFSERTITLGMECGDYKVSAGTHWLSTTPPKENT